MWFCFAQNQIIAGRWLDRVDVLAPMSQTGIRVRCWDGWLGSLPCGGAGSVGGLPWVLDSQGGDDEIRGRGVRGSLHVSQMSVAGCLLWSSVNRELGQRSCRTLLAFAPSWRLGLAS